MAQGRRPSSRSCQVLPEIACQLRPAVCSVASVQLLCVGTVDALIRTYEGLLLANRARVASNRVVGLEMDFTASRTLTTFSEPRLWYLGYRAHGHRAVAALKTAV